MPRRPRKQPGLARKTSFKTPLKTLDKNDDNINKWDKPEDIELDEEDQFHRRRDRILLEAESDDEDNWENEEEEVFGLGLDTGSEDDRGDAELSNEDESHSKEREPSVPKFKKGKTSKRPASPSSSSTSGTEEETWGRKTSAYYASNNEELSRKKGEDDEDELNEMEEEEARKIQSRLKNLLLEEDYGLDDVRNRSLDLSEEAEPIPAIHPTAPVAPIDKATALRHLEKTSPETLALSREWCDVLEDLQQVEDRIKNGTTSGSDVNPITNGFRHLYHQTLLSYITVLAFYIHLRASDSIINHPSGIPNPRVKVVLQRLLTLKQALSTMEDLDFDASIYDDESDILDISSESSLEQESVIQASKLHKRRVIEMDELYALLKETDEAATPKSSGLTKSSVSAKTVAKKPKKKKQITKEEVLFDLAEPLFKPSRSSKALVRKDDTSEVYGEVTELPRADSMDKKNRRHTLRFHTHRIETSVRKREQAREKLGGDDDIPYVERKKEKEARIQKEVLKLRGTGGDDLEVDLDDDNSVVENSKRKRERDESSGSEGEDGYYELVKRAKKDYKEEKRREYDRSRLAERVYDDDEAENGPRSLTRAILKNRGLTPSRSKSVRNPRVKKRERYEKAKKKVRSQKAVYRGGLGGRPYGGEGSGISKVVKSVKLG